MGVGRGGKGAVPSHWIFIHDTDKVEGGLMVLFLGLVFSFALLPGNFSADALNCKRGTNRFEPITINDSEL